MVIGSLVRTFVTWTSVVYVQVKLSYALILIGEIPDLSERTLEHVCYIVKRVAPHPNCPSILVPLRLV